MSDPQIVPPEEARDIAQEALRVLASLPGQKVFVDMLNLAHTAAVRGEQVEAVLALHSHGHWCWDEAWEPHCYLDEPCPTAIRARRVTGE